MARVDGEAAFDLAVGIVERSYVCRVSMVRICVDRFGFAGDGLGVTQAMVGLGRVGQDRRGRFSRRSLVRHTAEAALAPLG